MYNAREGSQSVDATLANQQASLQNSVAQLQQQLIAQNQLLTQLLQQIGSSRYTNSYVHYVRSVYFTFN